MDALTREPADIRARPRLRRWGMVGLCLLLAAAIIYAIWFFPGAAPPPAKHDADAGQPVPVLTAQATASNVPIYLDGLGTVQAFYTVTMKPMVDGPLIAVKFKEGQEVHKGDVLAQIDPRTYQAALDSAMAKKAQDQAQLANARLDLARQQKLVANNYTSAQQADTAKAQVAQFEALVQQDQAQIDTARTQLSYTTITAPIDGRTGIRQVDPGNIVHATDSTGIVVITQLQPIAVLFTLPQQALPKVAQAMADANASNGSAPNGNEPDGGASNIGAPKGNTPDGGAPNGGASNGNAPNGGEPNGGAPVLAFAQDAAGAAATLLDTGRLTVLDNQVDPTTGTIKLKAVFPNSRQMLWPGGFVRVRLRTETANDAIVVPPSAIQRGPRGPYVFVIGSDLKSERKLVTVGYEDEQQSIIKAGLRPGETVVTDGASRLSDGTKVTIAKPDADAAPRPEQPAAPGVGRDAPR
ncbi:efflux RND transporter periplasmic adaptor subunit [Rhodopila sp.]|uniref:efflux RND transporter periplasmic adaptor subunit n=1 Tax=Rhodopila sp. TaxID=2480087 RepID=UPI003D136852